MMNKLITVIGGTGFVGQSIVNTLLRQGYDVQVLARHARDCKDLFPAKANGSRLLLRNADITQPKTLHDTFEGSWAIINLVGILYEKGRQRFSSLHTQCPERLAKMAKDAGCSRFIHLSALGAHKAKGSRYASSKATGETGILSAFPDATILSPSVIFGPNDNFINQFSQMANFSPILPLIGGGKTKFQPVYVGDVTEAVLRCIERPATKGKTFELGGPKIYSFNKILEKILKVSNRKRMLVSIPFGLAKFIGFFAEFAPIPPITRDQVQLLKHDSTTRNNGFKELGITPKPMELIIPDYIALKPVTVDAGTDKIAA
ncbi:MAG: complex I NDUFA9 subunit family protein [Rickettsiales bacterium]|nr:complex I NDUFA9 subunit family protein [Rickettsiales bacterium]